MQRGISISSLIALLACGCSTLPRGVPPQFTLQSHGQSALGPLNFQHGQRLRIGETEYVLVKNEPERWEMEVLLASVTISSITFREADIRDVLQFIAEGFRPTPPEINIVLKSKPDDIPKITMSFQRVSALHLLKTVCEIADLKFDVKQGVIIVETQ